jgi:hypothetical protein
MEYVSAATVVQQSIVQQMEPHSSHIAHTHFRAETHSHTLDTPPACFPNMPSRTIAVLRMSHTRNQQQLGAAARGVHAREMSLVTNLL